MTTPTWAPGTLYQPGALVIPRSSLPVQTGVIANANFADGDTGWALGSHFSIVAGTPFLPGSSFVLKCVSGAGSTVNDNQYAVAPGQLINGQCYGWTSTDNSNSLDVRIRFYDGSHTFLSDIAGSTKEGTGNSWQKVTVAAVAPIGAAFAAIGCAASSSGSDAVLFSNFTWDYTYAAPADALTYEAVQADAATSAATEPTWPLVAGETVVDGGVTWEAITFSQIVWTASPIMTSGDSEPTWPTTIGAAVADNTISWVATSRQITDPNCPNTKVVLIGSSKVFAIDDDIVDFCATTNPLDWTTQGDAGFLPTGLQQYGDNPNAALGLYRGNLVAFNSGGYQMWQIDPDPENMAILDAEPIGSTYPKAIQAVVNDLIFLTPLGVRSVGISGGSANLQAGNVGNQIDALVVAALAGLESGAEPRGLYYPARGQYWLFFGNEAFVMTVYSVSTAQMTAYNTTTQSWSRYVFPDEITDWTLLGNDLYLRTAGDLVWKVDPAQVLDDVTSDAPPGVVLQAPLTGATGSTTFLDLAGNILTANGAVQVAAESPFGGGSAFFPGISTLASITTPITPSGPLDLSTGDFTVEGWIYTPTPDTDSVQTIIDMSTIADTSFAGFRIQVGSSFLTAQFFDPYAGQNITTTPNIVAANTWTHFALVRDGTAITLYVNGIGTTQPTPYVGSIGTGDTLAIGESPIDSIIENTFWNGSIGDIRISNSALYTENFTPPDAPFPTGATGIPYTGLIQWPWIDMNSLGTEKNMISFDLVMTGQCALAIGYDQTDVDSYTPGFEVLGDTLTGQPTPYPVRAPSFSLQLTFDANQSWEWEAAVLYVEDDKGFK